MSFDGVEFAVDKAAAQLSDDLRAARATTGKRCCIHISEVPFSDIPGFYSCSERSDHHIAQPKAITGSLQSVVGTKQHDRGGQD